MQEILRNSITQDENRKPLLTEERLYHPIKLHLRLPMKQVAANSSTQFIAADLANMNQTTQT